MRQEPTFNEMLQSPEIPTSEEFWVGDLIYTEWILPLGLFTSAVYTCNNKKKQHIDYLTMFGFHIFFLRRP